MFDISFTEILLIGLVALVVIGPERLPKVARTLGHLFGRFQRYAGSVKADIEREMRLDDLRKLQTQVEESARSAEHLIVEETRKVESGLRGVASEVNAAVAGQPGPAATETLAAPDSGPAVPPVETPVTGEPARQLDLGLDDGAKKA